MGGAWASLTACELPEGKEQVWVVLGAHTVAERLSPGHCHFDPYSILMKETGGTFPPL